MPARIAKQLERRIVKSYQTTEMGGHTLARRFGIGATTLYRVLRRNGIPVDLSKRFMPNTRRFKFSERDQRRIADLYAEGVKPRELSASFQCSRWTIREIVRRHGQSPLRRGGQLRPWTPEQRAQIVQRYQDGESQEVIAARFKSTQTTISRVLAIAGVSTGRQGRERHGNWKGGRVPMGSYVGILIEPDSPYASMRMATGYVLEHRLVMAQHLGRPLQRKETVHHINGKKRDNRFENLELRQGKHGKGIVQECTDCGSRNIVTVTFA